MIFLCVLIVLSLRVDGSAFAEKLRGRVLDQSGDPVSKAEVSLWFGRALIVSNVTDNEGNYEIEADYGSEYRLLITSDDPSTPGVDHLPSWLNISQFEGVDTVVTLEPSASLIIEGDIQFVESDELPGTTKYSVLDPGSGDVINLNGFALVYGTAQESQNFFMSLEPHHIVIPVGDPFKVSVNCSLFVNLDMTTRTFELDELLIINAGDLVSLDLKPHSIRYNQEITSNLLQNLKVKLDEMEESGFYLVKEKGSVNMAVGWLSDSTYYLHEGRYIESFDSCKRSYIELTQTKGHLDDMLMDAATSVYVIVVFLSLASTTIAFLLCNSISAKVLSSIIIYSSFLIVLFFVYPGSVTVPLHRYVETGILSMGFSLAIATVFPSFMKRRGVRGHVPIRNIVVPIFSIAKRNIVRRRLRFLLTLSSITVLVMSFVCLTSISESYGLTVSKISGRGNPVRGLLIRAPGYTVSTKSFLSMSDINSRWIEKQSEVIAISYKAENIPLNEPITRLNKIPINGIVGFDPSKEAAMFDFEGMMKEGDLPSEGGIVISEALHRELDVNIGDILSLGGRRVRLDGIIDDNQFQGLKDLDGDPYLPSKLINMNPYGDLPDLVMTLCEPREVIITQLSTALEIPLTRISRMDLLVRNDVDVDALGERLALERGYLVWSASQNGINFAQLSNYMEGKGFPLLVPWVIVVLNVIVIMYNSMYERRKDINILSSVGLNPSQIATIFVAEAFIIGFIAGALGYLSSMVLYKGMHLLRVGLEVEQKISAFWSVASIGIAMITTLMGAFVALQSSVVITPSMRRRWTMGNEESETYGPWEITIPVKILQEELDAFTVFMIDNLHALENQSDKKTSSIKVSEEGEGVKTRIDFIYKAARSSISDLYTKNTFLVMKRPEDEIVITLTSRGKKNGCHEVGTLIRMITMRWSTSKEKLASWKQSQKKD